MKPSKLVSAFPLLALCALTWLVSPWPAAAQDQSRLVSTQALGDLVVYPRRTAPATVLSLNDSRISAEINARIESVAVKVGDPVATGDALVRLDCRDNRLALQRTKARLDFAHGQLKRAKSLRKKHNISAETYDQRQTDYDEADVAYQQAALNVERCVVRAPFEGVVMERLVSEGELAATGTPLLRLLDRSRLEVSAQVPAGQVQSLETAKRSWLEYGGRRWALQLRTATPAINPLARNRDVRLTFAEEPALPGTAGRLVWESAEPHLPSNLLIQRDGRLGVLVANGHRAHFRPLPEALEGQPARIELPLDTQIIVEGRHGLSDGDAVTIPSQTGD